MNDYDNTNRGACWLNDRKREGKSDPDYTGTLNVDGTDYFWSGWKNIRDGERQPVLTFSVNKKNIQPAQNIDDEIGF